MVRERKMRNIQISTVLLPLSRSFFFVVVEFLCNECVCDFAAQSHAHVGSVIANLLQEHHPPQTTFCDQVLLLGVSHMVTRTLLFVFFLLPLAVPNTPEIMTTKREERRK
ncbi:Hypothetical protein, putative [Bodo saltans]|uniref:Uncharacterized protein n=1 Tax=Bodo saltans TaxID=75058 RepID=A0A0S4IM93_BODSA|nr:Hypothetical protein, putative [Bodo saltans]|eukprot:CUF40325.1 Hypothetical protein, putative [Bodo saltans]